MKSSSDCNCNINWFVISFNLRYYMIIYVSVQSTKVIFVAANLYQQVIIITETLITRMKQCNSL